MSHPSDLLKLLSVSVIIPTFRRTVQLRRCLESLSKQICSGVLFEIIVVNDGGDPSPIEEMKNHFGHGFPLTLIHREHLGIAAARSCGIKNARGDIFAFLDDDCTVPSDYIGSIVKTFHAYPDTQVIQVALDNPEPENIFGYAWKRMFDSALNANLSPDTQGRFLSSILGGVMVARKSVFEKVSFDMSIRLTREDADLRCQLFQFNIPVHYEPRIKVFHFCRTTLRGYLSQHFMYGRGEFHFRRKWGRGTPPFQCISPNAGKSLRSAKKSGPHHKELVFRGLNILRRTASFCGLRYEKMKWSLFKAEDLS